MQSTWHPIYDHDDDGPRKQLLGALPSVGKQLLCALPSVEACLCLLADKLKVDYLMMHTQNAINMQYIFTNMQYTQYTHTICTNMQCTEVHILCVYLVYCIFVYIVHTYCIFLAINTQYVCTNMAYTCIYHFACITAYICILQAANWKHINCIFVHNLLAYFLYIFCVYYLHIIYLAYWSILWAYDYILVLPMPVSPRGVSGIFARLFRNCGSFDEL